MNVVAILAIVVGGIVVLAAAVITLIVVVRRKVAAHAPMSPAQAHAETARHGWTYAERDDSWAAVYARQQHPESLDQPFHRPPRATGATHVVTGTHRGRPFVAATFETVQEGRHRKQRAIWVAAPAPHPLLNVRRIAGPQNTLNRTIGRGGVQLGDPELDGRFEILCEDEAFALAVFGPELRALLLGDARSFRGFSLLGEYLDASDPVNDHRDPAELVPALDLRCDLLDRIPAWSRG